MLYTFIIIPILTIFFVIFITDIFLYGFNNELVFSSLLISTLIIILLTYLLPTSLTKLFKNSPFLNNLNLNTNILSSYISFILLFLFGISLMINSILFTFSIYKVFIGILIIVLFIYVNYFIFSSSEEELTVIATDKENGLTLITFEDDAEHGYEYYTLRKDIKIDYKYRVKLNKKTKWIYKIQTKEINR